jgi:hypothetical protein
VVFGFAVLPWYRLLSSTPGGIELRLYSTGFRGWYLAIPAAAGLGVLLGALNALMRPGEKGSVPLFISMQLLALVTIGLVGAAIFVRHPSALKLAHPGVTVALMWPAWGALAAAVVALCATLASGFGGKSS